MAGSFDRLELQVWKMNLDQRPFSSSFHVVEALASANREGLPGTRCTEIARLYGGSFCQWLTRVIGSLSAKRLSAKRRLSPKEKAGESISQSTLMVIVFHNW